MSNSYRRTRAAVRKRFANTFMEVNTEIERQAFAIRSSIKRRDIIGQAKNLCYLDLAVNPRNWKKHVMKRVVEIFPPIIGDFWLGERASSVKFLNLLKKSNEYYPIQIINIWHSHFQMHKVKYYIFTLKDGINRMDNEHKKKVILGYLKLYKEKYPFNCSFTMYGKILKITTDPLNGDAGLTIKVVESYIVNFLSLRRVFMQLPDACTLERVLIQAKERRFDFCGHWLRRGKNFLFNPVMDSLSTRCNFSRSSYLKVFLKYGFRYSSELPVYNTLFSEIASRRFLGQAIGNSHTHDPFQSLKTRLRRMLIMETFKVFANFREIEDISENVANLVVLTRTLPEPYVTPSEMFEELNKVLRPHFTEQLQRICDKYATDKVYEEDYTIFRPRTLTHLCRCKVRRMLADRMKLPEGIDALNVPREVKALLALHF